MSTNREDTITRLRELVDTKEQNIEKLHKEIKERDKRIEKLVHATCVQHAATSLLIKQLRSHLNPKLMMLYAQTIKAIYVEMSPDDPDFEAMGRALEIIGEVVAKK